MAKLLPAEEKYYERVFKEFKTPDNVVPQGKMYDVLTRSGLPQNELAVVRAFVCFRVC